MQPARLRNIKQAARHYGIEMHAPRSGSHFIFERGGKVFPISAHNGEKSEISNVYIRRLCEVFEIDYADFKKHL